MADRMIIEISADGRQADSVLSALRKELGNLESQALRMNAALNKGGSGLVDAYGVPISQLKAALNDVNQTTTKTAGGFAAFKTAVINGINNPMGAAASAAETLLTALGPVGTAIAAIGVVAYAVGKPLVEMTLAAGKASEQTLNMADRLGISAGQMKQLSAMAQIAGVDIGVLEGSTRIIATALEDSSGAGAKAAKALQGLGIATKEVNGAEREHGKVLIDLLDSLSQIEDGNKRALIATQVLGRGSKELLPLIKNMDDLKRAVADLHIGEGAEDGIRALAKMDDEVDKLELAWGKFKTALAQKIAPVIVPIVLTLKNTLTGDIFNGPESVTDQASRDAMSKARSADRAAVEAANRAFYQRDIKQYKVTVTEDDIKNNITQLQDDLKKQKAIFNDVNVFEDARAKAFKEMTALQSQINLKQTQLRSMERARSDRERAPEYTAGLRQGALDAENKDAIGVFKAEYDYQKGLEKLKTDRQDSEQNRALVERKYQAERLAAEKEFNEKVWGWQNKTIADGLAATKKQNTDRLVMEADTQLKMADLIRDNQGRIAELTIATEQKAAEERKNQELAALEGIDAQTIQQKAALEQQKLGIEKRYIDESLQLEIRKLELIRDKTVTLLEAQKALGNDAQREEIQKAIDSIRTTTTAEIDAAKQGAEEKKNTETVKAASNTAKIVRDQWQKTYDEIKRASEGVFDSMLTKSTSIWHAMADSFKNIFLTALKEIVSSGVARSLAGLFGGSSGTGQGSTGGSTGGFLDVLKGIFGGKPGATPPFLPAGAAAAVPAGGRWVMDANGNMTQIAKGSSGVFGTASAQGIFGQSGTFGKYGGAVQGGLLMGGAMLGMDGWNRGGAVGMVEMTGGGAAIGYAVGGPVGAAIGAGVGLIAGGLHWLFGSNPNDEMKKKVQQITGVRIDSKDTLKSLVQLWKASGVKIEDFVRSQQADQIISLYAMSTGQKYKSAYNLGQFNMMLSGGSLYEQASYSNGSVSTALSGLGFGAFDKLSAGLPSSGPNITLKLDPEATKAVLTGQAATVIQNNPRLVAASNNKAMSQNVGRFQIASVGSPTAIMA